ncbi:hypothetical protein OS189_09110 [Sulfitobacter sp. F26169L]|uniref:hypothetical protein n=1 Tax=Sulfitobacter sp. F26169L TaxID=2996015 RepID=UPI002260B442|nr:hypothetical protein [Sulfitobacter sp. F26169L]MCX7566497.1 hypothetical protein [Sulfitobacter sp. F26169L]
MPPDSYFVTATTNGMSGSSNFIHATEWRLGHVVVIRSEGEGAGPPIKTPFYCSPKVKCAIKMGEIPISFNLPVGWGAERPIKTNNGVVAFNMVTRTPDGPIYGP